MSTGRKDYYSITRIWTSINRPSLALTVEFYNAEARTTVLSTQWQAIGGKTSTASASGRGFRRNHVQELDGLREQRHSRRPIFPRWCPSTSRDETRSRGGTRRKTCRKSRGNPCEAALLYVSHHPFDQAPWPVSSSRSEYWLLRLAAAPRVQSCT
jgi:hypothetical protein